MLGIAPIALGCADLKEDRARRSAAEVRLAGVPRRTPPPGAASTDEPLLRELLRAHEFRRLDSLFGAYRDSVRADVAYEPLLFHSFDAFGMPDPALRPHLDAWVAAEPSSVVPFVARASHSLGMGWAARGTAWTRDTPREQLELMAEWVERAGEDLRAARRRDSTFVPAYWLLLNAAMPYLPTDEKRRIAEEALRIDPRSLLVRERYLRSVTPRWGGSYREMRRFAEESQRFVDQNPDLVVLPGFVAWDQGRSARDHGAKLAKYREALRYGDYWLFFAARARAHYMLDDEELAIDNYNLALQYRPNDVELLVGRGLAYWYLAWKASTPEQRAEHRRLARADVARAAHINPLHEDVRDALKEHPRLAVAQDR